MIRRLITPLLLTVLATPLPAQLSSDGPASYAVALEAFLGAGSGPSVAGVWGLQVELPIHASVHLQAEMAAWDGGFGIACADGGPSSYKCDVSGWSLLIGGSVGHAISSRVLAYVEGLGGLFSRIPAPTEEGRVRSMTVGIGGGVEVPLGGRWSTRIGVRHLRPFDDDYEALLGENLHFTVGSVGLKYRMGS